MKRIQAPQRIDSETRRAKRPEDSSPRLRAGKASWLARSGIFGLGLAAGVLLSPAPVQVESVSTQASAEGSRVEIAQPRRDDRAQPAAAQSTGPTRESVLSGWLEMAEAERLKSLARKVTGAGLDLVAESVIAQLEEDSLRSLIASTTDFSVAELSEIDDVPGFAMGLARIAMEGTVREASEPEAEIRPVDFSTAITWDHRASFAQSQFSPQADRIYAVFESDELGLDQTLAKWTRVDDGEILLFKRHAIRRNADSSYVYLNAPPGGFTPGEYRVDFYSADNALRWLASGQHRVSL